MTVEDLQPAVKYRYFEGQYQSMPDFAGLKPVRDGVMDTFSLPSEHRGDNFALELTGYIKIEKEGVYTFYTKSDDGSMLYIGDTLVVNNDGLHAPQEKSGQAALESGIHPIRVTFFEAGEAEVLEVSYEGAGTPRTIVPAALLFHK